MSPRTSPSTRWFPSGNRYLSEALSYSRAETNYRTWRSVGALAGRARCAFSLTARPTSRRHASTPTGLGCACRSESAASAVDPTAGIILLSTLGFQRHRASVRLTAGQRTGDESRGEGGAEDSDVHPVSDLADKGPRRRKASAACLSVDLLPMSGLVMHLRRQVLWMGRSADCHGSNARCRFVLMHHHRQVPAKGDNPRKFD